MSIMGTKKTPRNVTEPDCKLIKKNKTQVTLENSWIEIKRRRKLNLVSNKSKYT